MPGTYTKLYYHIVFSTKSRKPYIRQELEPQLHKYIAGTIRELGGSCIEINDIEYLLMSESDILAVIE